MLLSRRAFLARLGTTTVAAGTLAAMPGLLGKRFDAAYAQGVDLIAQTYAGMAAFWWPGDDEYSVAQGEVGDGPGAVAANAHTHLAAALDIFVPAPDDLGANDDTLPLSQVIAGSLNTTALAVSPSAVAGTFQSPFANLPYADKAEVWRILEEETQNIDSSGFPEPFANATGVLQFVYGVLPGFMQFFGFAEIDKFDAATRELTGRPVGWDHAKYATGQGTTLPEGWDEFLGYYQGRKAVNGSDGTGEVLA